jgi:hypothetical protein
MNGRMVQKSWMSLPEIIARMEIEAQRSIKAEIECKKREDERI